MKRAVTLDEYTCDGCGRTKYLNGAVDGPAVGYHGDVSHITGAGGHGATWYACRERCIRTAVVNALDVALDDDHTGGAAP